MGIKATNKITLISSTLTSS